jgi:hypothetical protein
MKVLNGGNWLRLAGCSISVLVCLLMRLMETFLQLLGTFSNKFLSLNWFTGVMCVNEVNCNKRQNFSFLSEVRAGEREPAARIKTCFVRTDI